MPARVLLVENELIIAADLRNKLTRLGHEVVGIAITGEEAVGMAEELRPDLVLMDIQLEGGMRGTECARTIQERTGAPIIFLTAFSGTLIRDATDIHPGICLSKPFSRVQLETALDTVLGKRSQDPS